MGTRRPDLPLPLPSMTPERRRLHERAQRLGHYDWFAVRWMTDLSDRLDEMVPAWTVDLLEHVAMLAIETPVDVVETLLQRNEKGRTWSRAKRVRDWGLAMGLWTDRPRPHRILDVTPLGVVVYEYAEVSPPEDPEAPERWREAGVKCGAIVQTARGAIGIVTEVDRHGVVTLQYRRGRTGERRPGDKLTVLAQAREPHPLREALFWQQMVPYKPTKARR